MGYDIEIINYASLRGGAFVIGLTTKYSLLNTPKT